MPDVAATSQRSTCGTRSAHLAQPRRSRAGLMGRMERSSSCLRGGPGTGAQEHPQPDTTARLQKQATHRDTHTHMKFPASRERGKQCFHHRLQVHKYVKPKAAAAAGDSPKRLWEDTRSPLTAVQPPSPPSLQGRWQRRGKPSQAQMRSCCACSPLLGCRGGAAPPTPKPSPVTGEAKPTATPAEPFLSLMLSA